MVEIGSNYDDYTLMLGGISATFSQGSQVSQISQRYRSQRCMTKIGSNDNYTLMLGGISATFREGTSFFSFSNLYDENWFN